MRLQIASDLHFEFRDDIREVIDDMPVVGDVLILAGDVHWASGLRDVMRQLASKWPRIIAVAGEREYYHANPAAVLREIVRIEREFSNVAYLHNGSTLMLDGQRFIGGTLWFPEQQGEVPADFHAAHSFVFQAVRDFVPWVHESNRATVKTLRKELRRSDVLVTHHPPSVAYAHDRTFVSPIDDLIAAVRPKLAVCGHVHSGADMMIGGTRTVCNPLGFPDEGAHSFEPAFTVEV